MKISLATLLFVCFTFSVNSQNLPPVITNVQVVVSEEKKQIVLSYDLADKENDPVKITLKASNDDGKTYTVNTDNIQGDIGFPVSAGKKKITWSYNEKQPEHFKIKLIADDLVKVNIQEVINDVDSTRMSSSLLAIYGVRSHINKNSLPHLENVRRYIIKQFMNDGLYAYKQKTVFPNVKNASNLDTNFENIIGAHTGHDDGSKLYIVSAHFDSEEKSPGADDNGSGVVGMLEVARILAKYNFKHAIKFIGFDGEEVGHVGSKTYIKHGVRDYESVEGVINFDMIGYYSNKPNSQQIPDGFEIIFPEAVKVVNGDKNRGNFVVNTSNANSKELANKFTSCIKRYVPGLKVVSLEVHGNGELTPTLSASDHYQFWKQGYKALHIGDGGETRNRHLDTKKDFIKLVNYTFVSNIVKATIATIAELAEIQHSSVTYTQVKFSNAN